MKYFCLFSIHGREDCVGILWKKYIVVCRSYHRSTGFGHVENEEIVTFGSFPIDFSVFG